MPSVSGFVLTVLFGWCLFQSQYSCSYRGEKKNRENDSSFLKLIARGRDSRLLILADTIKQLIFTSF